MLHAAQARRRRREAAAAARQAAQPQKQRQSSFDSAASDGSAADYASSDSAHFSQGILTPRSSSSGASSASGSPRTPASYRQSSTAAKAAEKARRRTGPTTLSLDPFTVSMSMHKQPSPRALLSAVKTKPLPVFTLPSNAPKLLLCIPLHAEAANGTGTPAAASNGNGRGRGAGSSLYTFQTSSAPSSSSSSSVEQSLKVYDADLPAFTFFKARLAEAFEGQEPQAALRQWARDTAATSGTSPLKSRGSQAQQPKQQPSLFHVRLSRIDFAHALRSLLLYPGGTGGSPTASPLPVQASEQLSAYSVALFRQLDHASRGSVLLAELVLGLSLFLPASSPSEGDGGEDKLRFAFRLLQDEQHAILAMEAGAAQVANGAGAAAAVDGLSEAALRPFYRSVYSVLSALCSTRFRMSVPSRPNTPALSPSTSVSGSSPVEQLRPGSASSMSRRGAADGPLSPSSLHSLPHELLQQRLESTALAQSRELFKLAYHNRAGASATAAAAAAAAAASASSNSADGVPASFRLDEESFLAVTRAHRHLLSFLHVLELDSVFSPKHADKESSSNQEAAAAAPSPRQQQSAFNAALQRAAAESSFHAGTVREAQWAQQAGAQRVHHAASGAAFEPLGSPSAFAPPRPFF